MIKKLPYLLLILLLILPFLYMCKKKESELQNPPGRQKATGSTVTFTTNAEVDKQLEEMAKSIVRIDHYSNSGSATATNPVQNFRIRVHDYMIPTDDDEVEFGTINDNIGQFNNSSYGTTGLNYSGQTFGGAIEHENMAESHPTTPALQNHLSSIYAIETKFNLQPGGAGPVFEAWNMYSLPHKDFDNTYELSEKYSLPMLVVPIVSSGYYNPSVPAEIRGYSWDATTGKTTYSTWASKDIFDDTEVDLDGDADGRPNWYIVFIYVKYNRVETSGDPMADCNNQDVSCGDHSCDLSCGTENSDNCMDCASAVKKTLRITGCKVEVDKKEKYTLPDEKYYWMERRGSGKYEIAATYLIVKHNGTIIHGFAYCDNDLLNPNMKFKRKNVQRDKYKDYVLKHSRGTSVWQDKTEDLTDNFNPDFDKIYIMFWELDHSWDLNGGDNLSYLTDLSIEYSNKLNTWSSTSLPSDTRFPMKYRSNNAPFGKKYSYFNNKDQSDLDDIENNWYYHVYVLTKNDFVFNGTTGKWVFDNANYTSNTSSQYGLQFKLEFDN